MPSTRRDALGAAASVASTCLAGCNVLSGTDSARDDDQQYGTPVTNYDTARHVVDGEQRLFRWTGSDDRPAEQLFLTTPDERSAVEFVGDTSPVAAFVAETDLSMASLALFQRRHDACRRIDAFGISKRPDDLRVHLCRELRPADEPCRTDRQRSTALAVRAPFDGASPSGLSVVESSRCEHRFGPYRDGGGR